MDKKEKDLCMGCMLPREEGGACPHCGYDVTGAYDPNYLPPGTALDERYMVGAVKHKNGEEATYLGYDKKEKKPIWVREYFPSTIVSRDVETGEVTPHTGRGAQFKALYSDYVDLCNEVRRLSVSDPVVPVENMLGANNTLYVVYKYIDTVTLEDYLLSKGGSLAPSEALDLLLPLLNAMDNIHSRGLIHRGLSPYTVLIDPKGKLFIDAFALSATRTGGSELEAELFNGYSAPEQYASTGWQGTWTDVYALATLFYRTISGIVPPKATRINKERPLGTLREVLSQVPPTISGAVERGMRTDAPQRTQTVSAFMADLLAQEGVENTAVFDPGRLPLSIPVDSVDKGDAGPRFMQGHTEDISSSENLESFRAEFRKSGTQPDRTGPSYFYDELEEEEIVTETLRPKILNKGFLKLVGLVVLVAIVLALLANSYINKGSKPTPPREVVATPDGEDPNQTLTDPLPLDEQEAEVPNFVDMDWSEVEHNRDYRDLYTFKTKEEKSDKKEAGIILSQSLASGTKVTGRTPIELTISSGGDKLKMPDLVGHEYEQALQELKLLYESNDLVFDPDNIQKISRFRVGVKEDEVLSTYPEAGKEFEAEKGKIEIHVGMEVATPTPTPTPLPPPVTTKPPKTTTPPADRPKTPTGEFVDGSSPLP